MNIRDVCHGMCKCIWSWMLSHWGSLYWNEKSYLKMKKVCLTCRFDDISNMNICDQNMGVWLRVSHDWSGIDVKLYTLWYSSFPLYALNVC